MACCLAGVYPRYVNAAGPAHDERLRRRTTAETATLGQAAAADDVTVDQASPATGQPCDKTGSTTALSTA